MMLLTYTLCFLYSSASLLLIKIIKADIVAYDGDNGSESFSNVELSFSRPFFPAAVDGAIVEANPSDACNNISLPPEANCSINWLVLITGNYCSYDRKLYHALLAGYSAVIIYNLDPSDTSYYKFNNLELNITAAVVKTASGLRLKEKYLFTVDERCRVCLIPNNPRIILKVLFFLLIVCTVPSFTMLALWIRDKFGEIIINRLRSQQLIHLMTSKYKKGDPFETCAICLEDYKEKDKLRILPCLHGYHVKCIDPWLKNNNNSVLCPLCKQRVNFDVEMSDRQKTEDETDSDTESRAESAPLLQSGRNVNIHGTFSTGKFVMSDNHTENASKTTSRDVSSEALDDTSDDFQSCTQAMQANRIFSISF